VTATPPEPGGIMMIQGFNFFPTTELKCSLTSSAGLVLEYQAQWYSANNVSCTLDNRVVPGTTYIVSVANWGSDYYSPSTAVALFMPVRGVFADGTPMLDESDQPIFMAQIFPPSAPPADSDESDDLTTEAIIAVIAAVVVAILLCICLSSMIAREKAGKPVFQPVGSSVPAVKAPVSTSTSASATSASAEDKL